MNRAAGAFPAAKARRGCARCWIGSTQDSGEPEDIDLIGDLAKNMLGRTFCPLGDAAALPTISIVDQVAQ